MNNNDKLNIEIAVENPCYGCNGECCDCNKFIINDDEEDIQREAEEFLLKLEINMRNRKEVTISI